MQLPLTASDKRKNDTDSRQLVVTRLSGEAPFIPCTPKPFTGSTVESSSSEIASSFSVGSIFFFSSLLVRGVATSSKVAGGALGIGARISGGKLSFDFPGRVLSPLTCESGLGLPKPGLGLEDPPGPVPNRCIERPLEDSESSVGLTLGDPEELFRPLVGFRLGPLLPYF